MNDSEVINSREIIERIEELGQQKEKWEADQDNLEFPEQDELDELQKLADQCKDCADWEYGETLIREDYFVEYCKDLVKDTGDIPSNLPWYIENHIDWDGVADELKVDYMEVDFNGNTYYIRG
jgi:hypothetical protein